MSDFLIWRWKPLSTAFAVFGVVRRVLMGNLCRFRNDGLLADDVADAFLLRAVGLTALRLCLLRVLLSSTIKPYATGGRCSSRLRSTAAPSLRAFLLLLKGTKNENTHKRIARLGVV